MITQPLLGHPPLLPGESLSSLIARLAKINEYEPRSILTSMIRESWKYGRRVGLSYLSLASQFTWLGVLTNVEPYELYRATTHRFSSILTPPENEITSIELSNGLSVPLLSRNIVHRQVRPEYASQFCPLCLKDSAYHRLVWFPMASSACLDHKCLLVSSCPECEKAVRIPDIIETHCSNCKADYREVEPISIENDSFGLFTQSLIQTWFTEGISPISPAYPLPQQMPRELYRVVDGLRLSIMPTDHDWPLLHSTINGPHSLGLRIADMRPAYLLTLTTYQSFCLYATACKGIINWPEGFHCFLTAYRDLEKASAIHYSTSSLHDGFGGLYQFWISRRWKQPSLEFVQQAFYEYLADNHLSFPAAPYTSGYKHTPELISKLRYLRVHEAVKQLGTTETRLRLMIRVGLLMPCDNMGKSKVILLEREDVLAFQKRWEQALTIEEAADWLGTSPKVVPQLVKVGLLSAQQTSAEGSFWMFSPSDVTECLERITERVGSYSSIESTGKEKMLSLKKTYELLQKHLGSGSSALVLKKVADGDLRAYIIANSRLQLRSLVFARSDIDAYIETVKAEKGWINHYEVAKILGINHRSVKRWVKTEVIPPATTEGNKHYFNRQAVEKLKSDLVFVSEATKLLGVSQNAVYALATYEVRCQLKVTCTEIARWVRQGKLIPLEDKALKPWFFSRQHISSFVEQSRTRQS